MDGTAREAYRYLYEPGVMTMINHPGLASDQWSTRVIPGAAAVLEAIRARRTARPTILDARGHAVPFEVLRHERVKRIIDKDGPPSDLDEFIVWLERNEIHECRFEALTGWRGASFALMRRSFPSSAT